MTGTYTIVSADLGGDFIRESNYNENKLRSCIEWLSETYD